MGFRRASSGDHLVPVWCHISPANIVPVVRNCLVLSAKLWDVLILCRCNGEGHWPVTGSIKYWDGGGTDRHIDIWSYHELTRKWYGSFTKGEPLWTELLTVYCRREIWGSRDSEREAYLVSPGMWCLMLWWIVTRHFGGNCCFHLQYRTLSHVGNEGSDMRKRGIHPFRAHFLPQAHL
jgi:hypothetical protein